VVLWGFLPFLNPFNLKKMLPAIIDENLVQLVGGEEWKEGRR
jgi:hypothetical protein